MAFFWADLGIVHILWKTFMISVSETERVDELYSWYVEGRQFKYIDQLLNNLKTEDLLHMKR